MKKIAKVILVLFIFQIQIFLFAKNEDDKYSIYFKDAIQKFHLISNTDDETGAVEAEKKVKNKKVGKAILINWSFILADSIKYWSKYTKWLEDWQFKLTWKDQKRRFFTTEAIKFDSNPFMTNWTHGLSGAAFYNMARYYRLSIFESFLLELSSSLSWEYITEWREVISINDVFFSGVGGIHIGEPFFQYGKYLLSKKGLGNRILGYLINPVFAVNDLLGNRKWRMNFKEEYRNSPDSYLYLGPEKSIYSGTDEKNLSMIHLGIKTSFLNIPEFEDNSLKDFSGRIKNTFFSGISFDLSLSKEGVEEYRFETESVIFGFAKKKFNDIFDNKRKGYRYYIGASTAFELFKKRAIAYYDKGEYHYDFTKSETPTQPTLFTDKFAIINLLGPAFKLSLFSGDFKAGLSLNAYFDFALVNSMALNEYSKYYPLNIEYKKTTLTHYGYYYAFGYTMKSQLSLSLRNIELTGLIKYQRYSSIESLDRFQENIKDDSEVIDSRTISRLELSFGIPKSPVSFIAAIENISRNGIFKSINYDENEKRIYTQVRLSF